MGKCASGAPGGVKLRRELHRAVGLRLEREHAGDADAAVLSNHFALAGDHVRAQRYASIAAKRATERFAHADAVHLYRRAIEAGRASGVIDPRGLAPGSRWGRSFAPLGSRRRRAARSPRPGGCCATTRSLRRGCATAMPTWRLGAPL
jgi:hypothetical protein